ncbi:ABC transporter substrate-binding protein [Vineibacter terrae]|uniref:ABC transporter substrate-binding protein n=1 Tax=Vineibacter terrae TaxID=2586908 RepID=A0A5C8PWH0_9HYPH|nr:ABC transporter substrate-binding protein [Vineibacter terrae]TXL82401.1 ABC transporter substrate-binding protein [Vineibacter terrae]
MFTPVLTRRASVRTLGAAALLIAASGAPVLAADAAEVVRNGANRILQVLKGGASDAAREATLTSVMNESFDLQAIGRSVLGRHWNAATPEQRQKFLAVFQKAEVKAYSDRFKQYSGQTFTVGKVSTNGSAQLVDSQIVQPNSSQPVRLVWEVHNGRITDVSIEGVSMAATRRSDFNAYIQRNGIDGLIAELQRRSG